MISISSLPKPDKPSRRSRPYRPRVLREERISPARSLGQHFLTDTNFIHRIVEAAPGDGLDAIIEVGPGLGVLTEPLLQTAPSLIAVEFDHELAQRLAEKHRDVANFAVVEADVLTQSSAGLLAAAGLPSTARYAVVGNLPYNAGTAIVRRFLEDEAPPAWLVVMLQREVAESISAGPGELGLLGVSVQVYAEARRLFNVPPRAFYPPPRVVSTVLRLDLRPEPLIKPGEREHFFRIVRAGFNAPRKRLRNSLAHGLGLEPGELEPRIVALGVDPALRPGDLRLDDWLVLSRGLEL